MAQHAPMVAGKEPDDPAHPDFSRLPELLWVKIFSLLMHRDLLALSVTCRKLYRVRMDSSVLWQEATVRIGICGDTPNSIAMLNKTELSIFSAHGHQLKQITFDISDVSGLPFDNASYIVLLEAAQSWQLQSLIIMCSENRDCSADPVIPKDLDHLLTTCLTSPSARQLSNVDIWASEWVDEEGASGAVEALKNASFTSSLRELVLGELLPHQRVPGELAETIGNFQNLQYLVIPLSYVSNCFLDNLPQHLKEVSFIVNRLDDSTSTTVTNWPSVLASRPFLKVGVNFFNFFDIRLPLEILPSVVPVSTVEICQCHDGYNVGEIFLQLSALFSGELLTLMCRYCDSGANREQVLMDTISQCTKLNRLHFSGSISSDTVIALARTRGWTMLQINEKYIRFGDASDREKRLQTLRVQVSGILGRPWAPCQHESVFRCQHSGPRGTQPLTMDMQPTTFTL